MTWDRNKTLIAAAGAILVLAFVVYSTLSGDESVSDREILAALGTSVYTVRCDGCQQVYEMPAADFTRGLRSSDEGLFSKCAKCGQRKAWRDAVGVGHPKLQGFDGKEYETLDAVRTAVAKLDAQIASARARLADPAIQSDAKQQTAIGSELELLLMRRSVLDTRWDELEIQEQSTPG